jgi:lysyl-tRNA synthetase class 1
MSEGAQADTTDGEREEEFRFWADEQADAILARDPEEPIVVKGGVSPSGVPHLGHCNEIVRCYFVSAVLRERGYEVRQVFTTDDRDPLRALPRTLADDDWNLVGLDEVDAGALGRNLGVPYTDVPDPFGDHDSYGEHFTALLTESAKRLDVPIDVVSNADLYESGAFDDIVRTLLENRTEARTLLADFQDGVPSEYVPFNPQCSSCGVLTTGVTDVDLDSEVVHYECTGMEAGGEHIEGCGHLGTATFREGKLPWRFEWPAQWQILGVDFEPFGKDHAEGSWPSGQRIARELLEQEPPVGMTYEWFTVDDEPLSSSSGIVVTVEEALSLVEPAVLRYFFSLDPSQGRDFSIDHVDQLVDRFDQLERRYFGDLIDDPQSVAQAERVYPFLVQSIEPERFRVPYRFAAVLGMTDDEALREEIARREGHIPETAPEWAIEEALDRVERARNWARRTDNEYNYELQRGAIPEVDLEEDIRSALADVADAVDSGADGERIQEVIYEAAEDNGVPTGEVFEAGYRLLFDQPRGPRLGPFLAKLDRTFVVDRLRLKN